MSPWSAPYPRELKPRQPRRPCRYGRNVRRRISSACARFGAAYSRSCAAATVVDRRLRPLPCPRGRASSPPDASVAGGGREGRSLAASFSRDAQEGENAHARSGLLAPADAPAGASWA